MLCGIQSVSGPLTHTYRSASAVPPQWIQKYLLIMCLFRHQNIFELEYHRRETWFSATWEFLLPLKWLMISGSIKIRKVLCNWPLKRPFINLDPPSFKFAFISIITLIFRFIVHIPNIGWIHIFTVCFYKLCHLSWDAYIWFNYPHYSESIHRS